MDQRPKYEGQNVVNPIASIEAARMLLEHLGEEKAAADIEKAVAAVLADGAIRTRDMGGQQHHFGSRRCRGPGTRRKLIGRTRRRPMKLQLILIRGNNGSALTKTKMRFAFIT